MIDIPLSLRVPPQGRYNRGIYTCYECDFEPPHYNVVPCMPVSYTHLTLPTNSLV